MGARSSGGARGGGRGAAGVGSAASFGRTMLAESIEDFNDWRAIAPDGSTTYHIPAGKLDAAGKAAAKQAGFEYNPKKKTYDVSVKSYGEMVSVAQSLVSGQKRTDNIHLASEDLGRAISSKNKSAITSASKRIASFISKMPTSKVEAYAQSTSNGAWITRKENSIKGMYDANTHKHNVILAKLYSTELGKRQ